MTNDKMSLKKKVLIAFLEIEHDTENVDETLKELIDEIEVENDIFTYQKEEYLILTDDEADERFEESLDTYIEECIMPEIPERYRFYFDEKLWKRDAAYDGRGNSLASYDDNEHEINYKGTYYYIYRTN